MNPSVLAGPDILAFEAPERGRREDLLVIDVDGFEGPLDLLLKLARDQKVDLTRISILALAEQYLAFVETARRLRLEVAADYLVMAAWLAYLKSRLLLPEEETDEEPSGDLLAAELAFRLRRLEAMREAGRRLMARSRLGLHVFARGMPEQVAVRAKSVWDVQLYDLLAAYAALRLHRVTARLAVPKRQVFTLAETRERLMRMLGSNIQWATLDSYLAEYLAQPEFRRTARASALVASLELAREGELELMQSAPFAPLYVRRRVNAAVRRAGAAGG